MIQKPRIFGSLLPDIRIDPVNLNVDDRGWFRRVWEQDADKIDVKQISISLNKKRGTLRGLHSLELIENEYKIIQVIHGEIFDVQVDMRQSSKNYLKWMGLYIDQNSTFKLTIPPGFCHGFITIRDNSIVMYSMSSKYKFEKEVGFRFDDPAIGIQWPILPKVVSFKDKNWKFLNLD